MIKLNKIKKVKKIQNNYLTQMRADKTRLLRMKLKIRLMMIIKLNKMLQNKLLQSLWIKKIKMIKIKNKR